MAKASVRNLCGAKLVMTGPEIKQVRFVPSTNTWLEIWTQQSAAKIHLFVQEFKDDCKSEFPCACLMNDDDFCDFELLTKDTGDSQVPSKIKVHRALLAATSPVLRQMLSSDFKEKTQGFVEVPADLATLEAFKRFLYTRTLPSDIKLLEQLICFSSYYMIPELEKKSIQALADMATERNAYDILEFAFENKAKKLSMAIFKKMGKTINLDKMDTDASE